MALIPRNLSRKGAKFIGEFEGYRANWYRDPVGVWTIGFGHTGPLPSGFTAPLDRAEAERLLIQDAKRFAEAVRRVRPRILRQTRFDALVSACFNLGTDVLDNPSRSLHKAAYRRDRTHTVPAALRLYVYAGGKKLPGLVRRRAREARLWETGRYEA